MTMWNTTYNIKHCLKLQKLSKRELCYKPCKILGIESSCDDTGSAIVNEHGDILGEGLHSQELVHIHHGGIIPPIAAAYHRQNIEKVVADASRSVNLEEIDAIAVTTRPGMPLSLQIGIKYAKHLCRLYKKPLIPIHHMEAHSLTARMQRNDVRFPFLVLLISGGHCLLALVQSVDKFLRIGESINDAPGEAFDKIARRMKLRNLPEFANLSGGQAIELAASRAANPIEFPIRTPMMQYKDCNFSFAGLKNVFRHLIIREERKHHLAPDEVLPNIYNLAAAVQLTMTRHLCHRTQRAMEYCEMRGLINESDEKQLIVSGGVACNNFINRGLKIVCDQLGYQLIRPPPKLCTDNGIMIAWNGVERWQMNAGPTTDYHSVVDEKSCPLGDSLIADVQAANISCNWVRLRGLTNPQTPDDIKLSQLAGRT